VSRVAPARQTDTVIRTPASMEDVFAQLEAPWELRDRQVVVRSYSMDPMTTGMLKELQEMYRIDMSTLVRQAVKGLYVEAKRRKRPNGQRPSPGTRKVERATPIDSSGGAGEDSV
jgi:hypothetical protein